MSVYCQFYDNKQNKISEVIVSNASISIPTNAVSGLFYDNMYKLDGLKLTLNNLTANDFSFDFAKDYFLYVFPSGYSSILATSVRSSSLMSGDPELSQNDIDYLKNLSDNSTVDLSSIVTALNSITTALSALTNLSNLSNLADLANIITAIQNKDNQSDIVDELRYIFTQNQNSYTVRSIDGVNNLSVFKNYFSNSQLNSLTNLSRASFRAVISNISNKLSSLNDGVTNDYSLNAENKFLYAVSKSMRALFSDNNSIQNVSISDVIQSSFFKSVSDKLENIETKLEQNLPFTTIVENEIVETNVAQNCSYGSKIEQIPFSE